VLTRYAADGIVTWTRTIDDLPSDHDQFLVLPNGTRTSVLHTPWNPRVLEVRPNGHLVIGSQDNGHVTVLECGPSGQLLRWWYPFGIDHVSALAGLLLEPEGGWLVSGEVAGKGERHWVMAACSSDGVLRWRATDIQDKAGTRSIQLVRVGSGPVVATIDGFLEGRRCLTICRFYSNRPERLLGMVEQLEQQPEPVATVTPGPHVDVGPGALAVADFSGVGVARDDGKLVAELVRAKLSDLASIPTIDQARMKVVLAEQRFQHSGCTDVECAVALGRALKARVVVVGTLARTGADYRLECQAFDANGGYLAASSGSFKSLDELAANAPRIAADLLGQAGLLR